MRDVLTSCEEHSVELAEVVPYPLSDLVGGPPVAVVVINLVRADDLLGSLENHLGRDLRSVYSSAPGIHFRELDVQPNDLVLPRDHHQAAVRGAVDHRSISNVGW